MDQPAQSKTLFKDIIATALNRLGAKAAGLWRIDGGHLILLAFVGDETLDLSVAQDFAESTRVVHLDPASTLGIIGAAMTGKPTISRASELSPNEGSGRWLRSFRASRSIAVALGFEWDHQGKPRCRGVLSVALTELNDLEDEQAIQRLLSYETELLRDL